MDSGRPGGRAGMPDDGVAAMKEKLLAVDFGDVRTGLAVSDDLGMLAVGLETVRANGQRALMEKIIETARAYNVTKIIVGNPVNMNGTLGERSERCRDFAQRLGEAAGLPVEMFDERCTTMLAHTIMNETNTRGKKRKNTVDTLSAQIILQDYMDSHRGK